MRRSLFIVIFVGCLVLGSGLRIRAILNTDITEALGRPLIDDSFYYFSLGRNWAAGNGPRIDAAHLTTGFQPLWGWFSPVPYLLFPNSDASAIATFQVMGTFAGLSTALLVYWLAMQLTKSRWIALATMALWWLSPQTVVENVSGMETSLAALSLMAVLIALYNLVKQPTYKNIALTGVICGLAFLCRIDTLLLTGAIGFILIFNFPHQNLTEIIKRVGLFTICAVVALLPWGLFVLSLGKPFLPESGDAVRQLSASIYLQIPKGMFDINQAIYTNANNLSILNLFAISFLQYLAKTMYVFNPLQWLTLNMGEQTTIIAASLGLVVAIFIFISALLNRKEKIFRILILAILLYASAMIAIYSYYLFSIWFFGRYASPIGQIFSIVLTILILRRAATTIKPNIRRALIAICASWIVLTGVSYVVLYLDQPDVNWIIKGPDGDFNNSMYSGVEWVRSNLEPDVSIGAFQSGLVGYSLPNVYNLDGKVNKEAFNALHRGEMWEYLCRANINYVVDWAFLVDALIRNRSLTWEDSHLTLVFSSAYPPTMATVRTNVYKVNCEGTAQN